MHEKIYGKKHAEENIRNETNAEDNTRKKQAEHTQKTTTTTRGTKHMQKTTTKNTPIK